MIQLVSIEDNNKNLTWWWSQLNLSDDWNSMPVEMREDLLKKLKQCLLDLAEFNITKDELTELMVITDPPTVWDAILALGKLPDKKKRNRWELLAYLKSCVIGKWQEQHPSRKPTWQKKPSEDRKEQKIMVQNGSPADDDHVYKNNPNNFKRCSVCGGRIRSDNITRVCAKCQRRGNGKDSSEH